MNLRNLLNTILLQAIHVPLTVSRKTSENRDGVGKTLSIFQILSSEGLKSQQADTDVVTSLLKLRYDTLD